MMPFCPEFDDWFPEITTMGFAPEDAVLEMQAFAEELVRLKATPEKEREQKDIRDEKFVVEVPEELF